MDVLLVDLILGDHSPSYIRNIKSGLAERDGVSTVDFLTLEPDDRLESCFDSLDDVYFIREDGAVEYGDPITDGFAEMVEFIEHRSYDVVHILQIDNVLIEAATVLPTISGLPPIVGQINGAFFRGEQHEWTLPLSRLASGLLSSPLAGVVETALVRNKASRLARDISLYRCLRTDVFSHLLVHTTTARKFVTDLGVGTTPVTVVPEPPTVEPPRYSQAYARQQLGIGSDDTVLLFFGGLRTRKGISRLLNSLETYDGPDFTLLVAGPEENVTEKDLREIEEDIRPQLLTEIKYITDSEKYFVASDGVLCPYLDTFGEERTSHVLQEAVKLGRPVICPAFGSFESRLRDYDLGVLYTPNTAQSLNDAIRKFVENPDRWYSAEDMTLFSDTHSFENLCSELTGVYASV